MISTLILDIRKNSNAINANFIQSFEACILHNIIYYLKKDHKEVDLITIHDCFLVSPVHSVLIKNLYIKALNEVVCNMTPEKFIDMFGGLKNLDKDTIDMINQYWQNPNRTKYRDAVYMVKESINAITS